MICKTPDLGFHSKRRGEFPAVYFQPSIAGSRRFTEPDMEIEKSLSMETLYLDIRRLK